MEVPCFLIQVCLVKYMYYVVISLQPDFVDFAPEIKSYKSRRLCLFVSGEGGEAFWMKLNYSE